MTEKLYYQDSYLSEFEAKVLSCAQKGNKYEVVLSGTAFFPEGGGQTADTGILSEGEKTVQVLDVQEKEGILVHETDGPLTEGAWIKGKLNFQERFIKMQEHTGEHIVSGIVYKRFGYQNVGFHLGKEEVTMDYNGPLTEEELREIEYEANRAVAEDVPIVVLEPSREELKDIFYRSKMEIEGQVRIVQIPGYDSCACCAPHVKTTGSVGMIKITGAIRYKGGMRLSLHCGFRALLDYRQKETSVKQISNRLSAKQEEVFEAVKRMEQEIAALKEKNKKLQEKLVAAALKEEEKKLAEHAGANLILFVEDMDVAAMRNFVNEAMEKTEGVCGVFAGTEESGFRYVLGQREGSIHMIGKPLNEAFHGKGGGKPPMIQGSLKGNEEKIRAFLEETEG